MTITVWLVGAAVACAGGLWVVRGAPKATAPREDRTIRAVVLSGIPRGLEDAVKLTAPTRASAPTRTRNSPAESGAKTETKTSTALRGAGKWHPFGLFRARLRDDEITSPPPPETVAAAKADEKRAAKAAQPRATSNGALAAADGTTTRRVAESPAAIAFGDSSADVHPLEVHVSADVVDAALRIVAPDPVPAALEAGHGAQESAGASRDDDSFLFAGLDVSAQPARPNAGQWAEDFYGSPMEPHDRRDAIMERVNGLALTAQEAEQIYRDDPEVREALWASAVVAADEVRRQLISIAISDGDEIRVTDAIDLALAYNDLDLVEPLREGDYAEYLAMRESDLGIE